MGVLLERKFKGCLSRSFTLIYIYIYIYVCRRVGAMLSSTEAERAKRAELSLKGEHAQHAELLLKRAKRGPTPCRWLTVLHQEQSQ